MTLNPFPSFHLHPPEQQTDKTPPLIEELTLMSSWSAFGQQHLEYILNVGTFIRFLFFLHLCLSNDTMESVVGEFNLDRIRTNILVIVLTRSTPLLKECGLSLSRDFMPLNHCPFYNHPPLLGFYFTGLSTFILQLNFLHCLKLKLRPHINDREVFLTSLFPSAIQHPVMSDPFFSRFS